jgi:hypothetical protein
MSSVRSTSPSFLSCLWISSAVMGKGRPQEARALRSALMQASRADRNCTGKGEEERISVRLMADIILPLPFQESMPQYSAVAYAPAALTGGSDSGYSSRMLVDRNGKM